MKTTIMTMIVLMMALFMSETSNAQDNRDLQYFRSPDKTGHQCF
jgi:hypothetical protein